MKTELAIFAGGCFWCTEAVFRMLKGVMDVRPGYAGEPKAEVVRIEYDPAKVKYEDLLTVFFASHDPSSLNKQGNDIGTQYRSAIFYTTEEQRQIAQKMIKEIDESAQGKPIVTEIIPLGDFHEAEEYHQDFYRRNKNAPYCQVIINPKLEKIQKNFAQLLKDNS